MAAEPQSAIPIVDFSVFGVHKDNIDDTSEEAHNLGAEILRAFSSVGFVYLRNHGIPESKQNGLIRVAVVLIRPLFDIIRCFNSKMAYDGLRPYRLLFDIGRCFYGKMAYDGLRPYRLLFDIGRCFYGKMAYDGLRPYRLLFDIGLNKSSMAVEGGTKIIKYLVLFFNLLFFKWPNDEAPGFESKVGELYNQCIKLTFRVLHAVSLGMDLKDKNWLLDCHKGIGKHGNATTMRILYYPPITNNNLVKPGQVSIKAVWQLKEIFGIILVAIGGWAEAKYGSYLALSNIEYASGSRLLIAVGVIIAVVAFCGCCGAYKENKCVLMIFFALLLIILILEITSAALAYQHKDKEKCCGGISYRDWTMNPKFNVSKVPDSCCITKTSGCGSTFDSSTPTNAAKTIYTMVIRAFDNSV
ncbi:predicted protein [Nematostella vectensis]|uniref:Non-haem dioxygenase N-terminal domain-containing protein n=1 Tax=Nematostella vectensis TaxID=45351 RepID=A7SZI3_NEMVE|nr:predicted protein [Nematostella vectensis]|eukprot:XP_001622985.1 predicted protein [Nematostella vectensis]